MDVSLPVITQLSGYSCLGHGFEDAPLQAFLESLTAVSRPELQPQGAANFHLSSLSASNIA